MRSGLQRLGDMLDCMDLIDEHMPANREAYDSNIVLKYFLLKQVEIIGEAAFKLDREFKARHPGIPWRKIEGSRHILVHDYVDLDWGILWDILTSHIGPLRKQLEAILHDSGEV